MESITCANHQASNRAFGQQCCSSAGPRPQRRLALVHMQDRWKGNSQGSVEAPSRTLASLCLLVRNSLTVRKRLLLLSRNTSRSTRFARAQVASVVFRRSCAPEAESATKLLRQFRPQPTTHLELRMLHPTEVRGGTFLWNEEEGYL